MNTVPLFPGRRRLLALCAVSLLLHVAVLAWIARRAPRLPPAGGDAGALVLRVRVAPAQGQGFASEARAERARATAAGRGQPPVLGKYRQDRAADAPDAGDISPKQGSVPDAADAAADATIGSPALAPEVLFGAPQAPLDSARQRFRVHLPPPLRLEYAVTHSAPGAPPQPAAGASLTWRTANGGYRLQLDGVPTIDGRRALASSGMLIDLGMAPRDADTGEPRAAQDEASVLMLLASMGVQDPGQLQDEVRILVETDGVPAVLAFKVIGPERIASGVGPLDTLRLAQVSGPGNARLEVWLAPDRNWMPVQLRDTWADGSVTTRLVERMAAPAD